MNNIFQSNVIKTKKRKILGTKSYYYICMVGFSSFKLIHPILFQSFEYFSRRIPGKNMVENNMLLIIFIHKKEFAMYIENLH